MGGWTHLARFRPRLPSSDTTRGERWERGPGGREWEGDGTDLIRRVPPTRIGSLILLVVLFLVLVLVLLLLLGLGGPTSARDSIGERRRCPCHRRPRPVSRSRSLARTHLVVVVAMVVPGLLFTVVVVHLLLAVRHVLLSL